MIHSAGIDQILLGRIYLNRNAAAAEELFLDLLFDGPRNVTGVDVHAADGGMLNGSPGGADLTAAHGKPVVRFPVPLHLGRPGSAVQAEHLIGIILPV